MRAFGPVKDQADRDGKLRLADKTLCDYFVLLALEIANNQEMPIQFHTGFGDTDVDLIKANPLYMRPLFQSGKFNKVPFVLLHSAYPYTRELGYLAAQNWREAESELKASGETLDFMALVPERVPESDNFFAIEPLLDIAGVMDNDETKGAPAQRRQRLEALKLAHTSDQP